MLVIYHGEFFRTQILLYRKLDINHLQIFFQIAKQAEHIVYQAAFPGTNIFKWQLTFIV